MELNTKFNDEQIDKVRHQGFIYSCACPSQVSEQIGNLRQLYLYEFDCMEGENSFLSMKTHQIIAEATQRAHDIMEQCLQDILIHEKWDLDTLTMPENLRHKLESTI